MVLVVSYLPELPDWLGIMSCGYAGKAAGVHAAVRQ